jgi:hypothetical protein
MKKPKKKQQKRRKAREWWVSLDINIYGDPFFNIHNSEESRRYLDAQHRGLKTFKVREILPTKKKGAK